MEVSIWVGIRERGGEVLGWMVGWSGWMHQSVCGRAGCENTGNFMEGVEWAEGTWVT